MPESCSPQMERALRADLAALANLTLRQLRACYDRRGGPGLALVRAECLPRGPLLAAAQGPNGRPRPVDNPGPDVHNYFLHNHFSCIIFAFPTRPAMSEPPPDYTRLPDGTYAVETGTGTAHFAAPFAPEAAPAAAVPAGAGRPCTCSFLAQTVGDGCEKCTPECHGEDNG